MGLRVLNPLTFRVTVMPKVLTTVKKLTPKRDATLKMYSLKIDLPNPNGPLIFGVKKNQLKKLHGDIAKLSSSRIRKASI